MIAAACLLSATLSLGQVFCCTTGAPRDGGEDDVAVVCDGVGCPLPSSPSLAAIGGGVGRGRSLAMRPHASCHVSGSTCLSTVRGRNVQRTGRRHRSPSRAIACPRVSDVR